jgi:transcriptional regulator with XRE-family HTH domain
MTQQEVANFLNITIRHYKALEGGTSDGSVKIWQQLAQKFNTTVDYLLQQEPATPPNSNTDEEAAKVLKNHATAAELLEVPVAAGVGRTPGLRDEKADMEEKEIRIQLGIGTGGLWTGD